VFRAAAGAAPWLLSLCDGPAWIAAMLIPLALTSDIFDGVLARRWGVASTLLRRADGWADLCFVLSYTAFCLLNRWPMLEPFALPIVLLGGLKLAATLQDFLRYGRGAAFHFWSAKLWALPYYALLFELMADTGTTWFFWPTFVAGVIAISEEMVAVRLIPMWMHDQPHIFAALQAARQKSRDRATPPQT
jgi:phosphatidylglycerophosphate synthase